MSKEEKKQPRFHRFNIRLVGPDCKRWEKLLDQLTDKARKEDMPRPVPAELDWQIITLGMESLERGVVGKGVVGAALPKEKREEVLRMSKEGKSVKEISEKTGVKVKTVQTWLRREKARQAKKAEKQKQPEQVEGAQVQSA